MIAFRKQMNFLEYLLLFLPLLWFAAVSYGDYWAASLGLSYDLGRFLYGRNYPMGYRGRESVDVDTSSSPSPPTPFLASLA